MLYRFTRINHMYFVAVHGNVHMYSISKGTGYKTGELTDLQEGSSLLIGGKEIEVSSVHLDVFN